MVGVIAGTYGKTEGGTQGDYVPTLLLDVTLRPDVAWRLPVDSRATLFVYIVEGAGVFGDPPKSVDSHRAVLYGDGDEFTVQAGSDGIRFVLFAGRPLHEPVAWGARL